MRITQQPVDIKLPYQPLPKQGEFHGHAAKHRFFGGGWGNGKTSAGCAEAFFLSMEYPGTEGLIARKTRPELKATTQKQFFEGGGGNPETDWTGCPQEVIQAFNKTEGKLTFINGSIIHFWPLDEPQKLSNLNLGWFLIDQGEEVAEEMFMMLEGRLRRQDSPLKGMVLFNPAGHDWIWRRCVYLQYPDHGLVHAKTTDNPNLPKEYVESLMKLPESWRKRFVEGSFDVFEGQIWPEFNPEVHVIRPIPVEPWWQKVEGIDHGRRNPTSVLWSGFDDKGNCFIFDEHLEAGKLVGFHAEEILRRRTNYWGEPYETIIDASAAAEDPVTGRSIIDEYWDYGIAVNKSDRHVAARINRVAEWLRLDPDHPHPLTGETRTEGWPHLWVFNSCTSLIEHVSQYQWKKQPVTQIHDPKEEPLEKDDHDVDCLGYILMSRPPPGKQMVSEQGSASDWYWKRVNDRIAGRARGGHSMLGSEA